MKSSSLAVIGVVIVVLGLVALGSVFTVHQREQAIVLRLGEPNRVVSEPGLKFKIPFFVEDVVLFDKRVLDFDAKDEEVPTRDQKQLVVDAFARYRIVEPLQFFQSVQNEFGMELRLNNLINANLRAIFGEVPLSTLLSKERADLVDTIADRVRLQGAGFGIEVIDVRIRRIDLPTDNSQAIFRRMQTQREQEARKIRAEGEADSRRIRADADKQGTIVRAEARRQSEILRGEGDGEAQRIFNEAFGQDPEFYAFWDTMRAMQDGLKAENTTYIGPPDGDFFRYFGSRSGREGQQNPPR
jgi:membrane protease subunit HflC